MGYKRYPIKNINLKKKMLMGKKLACLFPVLIVVCFAACNSGEILEPTLSPNDSQAVNTSPVVDLPPIIIVPPSYNATVEYGDPDLITNNIGPLWAYIRFPVAGDTTDEIVARWAHDVYQNAYDEIVELRKDDPKVEGEVNVQFDSYLVDSRYAGILENGMFMSSHLAHPISIVRTFNIDIENGIFLDNADILDFSQLESVFFVLRERIVEEYPDAAILIGEMDEKWFEHMVVGHDGIIVVLDRGVFLPTYLGTIIVTLPYEQLGSAFVLGAKSKPTAPPNDAPAKPTIPNVPPQSGDIDPSKPMVALTFDDGPSKYTSQILDILEKYGARATFCVVGNLVNARQDTVKRASDLGCEIIGHSWDHRDLSKLSVAEIKKELDDTSAIIESVTGVWPRLYRPPYGAVNSTLKNVSGELGYAIIYWSVDALDWDTRNADKIYKAIIADTSNRAIVLSHDLYGSTADAMERVIPELLSKGYQLVTVSELMYYSDKTLEAGVVYYSGK